MSDDISMGALSGSLSTRTRARSPRAAYRAFIANGEISEMREVAQAAPILAGDARRRAMRFGMRSRQKVSTSRLRACGSKI